MKNIFVLLIVLLLCNSVSGQWKAQAGEMYDKTFRMAYVTSKSGNATLRVLRNIPLDTKGKAANPYDQITGQILLNKKIEKEYVVQCLVFSFDDSPKIYIHQPSGFKQSWDPNSKKYIIESDWKMWRLDDRRNKDITKGGKNPDSIPTDKQISIADIIQLLKSHQIVHCQVVLMHEFLETQTIIDSEFTLQNSTKSINFLFQ